MMFNVRRYETKDEPTMQYTERDVLAIERREFRTRNAHLDKHGRAERLFQRREETSSHLKQLTKRKHG